MRRATESPFFLSALTSCTLYVTAERDRAVRTVNANRCDILPTIKAERHIRLPDKCVLEVCLLEIMFIVKKFSCINQINIYTNSSTNMYCATRLQLTRQLVPVREADAGLEEEEQLSNMLILQPLPRQISRYSGT